MPTPTYDLIASTTLAASSSSVTFSGFPTDSTYRDLVVVINHTKSALTTFTMRFNGDNTTGNYTSVYMVGDGSNALSGTETGFTFGYSDTTRSTQIANIMDYSATDKHKTVLLRHSDSARQATAYAGRWANTAAISSIVITTSSGTFDSTSTFALYGIAS